MADDDATLKQQLLNVAQTGLEAKVPVNRMALMTDAGNRWP